VVGRRRLSRLPRKPAFGITAGTTCDELYTSAPGYGSPMALDLFAGNRVSDYETARTWYERLLGSGPSFTPHETEAVWEVAEHRFVYILEDRENPGGGMHLLFVDDLDARVEDIASRGIEPDERERYPGKARKAIYRDPDGNELGFGGAPV
jgi:catechol 2,3-dioxygenase-like lactoylglutathione lyase family enzyme